MTANDPFSPGPKLIPSGMVSGKTEDFSEDQIQLRQAPFKKAQSFAETLDDFAFFTPALMYLRMPFYQDPIHVFNMEYGQEVSPISFRFESPILQGLGHPSGDESWNHVLYCLEKEHWEHYKNWMGTVSLSDPRNERLHRIRFQELHMLDPMWYQVSKPFSSSSKVIPVTMFCVETNHGSFFYRQERWPDRLGAPKAVFDEKVQYLDTQAFASAIQDGDTDPYKEVDRVHHEESQNESGDDPPVADGS